MTREVVKNFVGGLGENSRLGMVIFDREADLAKESELEGIRIFGVAFTDKADCGGCAF